MKISKKGKNKLLFQKNGVPSSATAVRDNLMFVLPPPILASPFSLLSPPGFGLTHNKRLNDS